MWVMWVMWVMSQSDFSVRMSESVCPSIEGTHWQERPLLRMENTAVSKMFQKIINWQAANYAPETGGVLKWRYPWTPQKLLGYDGKPHWKGWFKGYLYFRKPPNQFYILHGGFLSHRGTPESSSIYRSDFPSKHNLLLGSIHFWKSPHLCISHYENHYENHH